MKKADPSFCVEVAKREDGWIMLRIHGEWIKLTPAAARTIGSALLRLAAAEKDSPAFHPDHEPIPTPTSVSET